MSRGDGPLIRQLSALMEPCAGSGPEDLIRESLIAAAPRNSLRRVLLSAISFRAEESWRESLS